MKRIMLCLTVFIGIAFCSKAQQKSPYEIPTWTGRWTEKQNEISASEWVFQGKDNIAKISYWGNGTELGGTIHKGKFKIDLDRKLLTLDFDNLIYIKDNKVGPTSFHEEFAIVSIGEKEITLSKLTVNKQGVNETTYVKLKRTFKIDEELTAKNHQ